MNNGVAGTGKESGPAASTVCGQRGCAQPSGPSRPTSKQSAVADSRGLVSDMTQRAAFCDVWLRLGISLRLTELLGQGINRL